jgi:hypothetical protein
VGVVRDGESRQSRAERLVVAAWRRQSKWWPSLPVAAAWRKELETPFTTAWRLPSECLRGEAAGVAAAEFHLAAIPLAPARSIMPVCGRKVDWANSSHATFFHGIG